jgi:glutaredoxin
MSTDKKGVVRLLTLSDCDYCMWLKSELDGEGIAYEDIDAYKFSDFADEVENKYKTESYPIVFIFKDKTITIVSDTELETSDTLLTFNTIPELISIIKKHI